MTGTPSRRTRLVRATTAAALATGALLATAAPPASASGDGCTYTSFPHEYVCVAVEGTGLHVDRVTVVRGRFTGTPIHDYHAVIRVRTPAGAVYRYTTSTHDDKSWVRATRSIAPDRSYPDGSSVCGSFYEDGDLQDTACVTVHD